MKETSNLGDLAQLGLACLTLITIAWGIFTWRAQKRSEAMRWQHELLNRFYFSPDLKAGRIRFEYRFFQDYAPVMERWLTDRDSLNESDIERLAEVDAFLNFFENVLFLVENKQLTAHGSMSAFSYWFTIMNDREHAVLRRYTVYGFKNLQRYVDSTAKNYLAVGGTLCRGQPNHPHLVGMGAVYERDCTLPGALGYIGYVPVAQAAGAPAGGELYRLPADFDFTALDAFMHYRPADWPGSVSIRRYMLLAEPAAGAWVYLDRPSGEATALAKSGHWDPKRVLAKTRQA